MKRRKPAQLTPRYAEARQDGEAWLFPVFVKTTSEMNRREHWAAKARRHKAQREVAAISTGLLPAPVRRAIRFGAHRITLTRIGGRKMDDDNLGSAMKYIRDGIAAAVAVDDGSSRIEWAYGQQPDNKRDNYVVVRVEWIDRTGDTQ